MVLYAKRRVFSDVEFGTQWDGLFIVVWGVSSVMKCIRGVSYLLYISTTPQVGRNAEPAAEVANIQE